jgi:hypothetical protein
LYWRYVIKAPTSTERKPKTAFFWCWWLSFKICRTRGKGKEGKKRGGRGRRKEGGKEGGKGEVLKVFLERIGTSK